MVKIRDYKILIERSEVPVYLLDGKIVRDTDKIIRLCVITQYDKFIDSNWVMLAHVAHHFKYGSVYEDADPLYQSMGLKDLVDVVMGNRLELPWGSIVLPITLDGDSNTYCLNMDDVGLLLGEVIMMLKEGEDNNEE